MSSRSTLSRCGGADVGAWPTLPWPPPHRPPAPVAEPVHRHLRDRSAQRLVRRLPAHARRDRRLGQHRRRGAARDLEAAAGAARPWSATRATRPRRDGDEVAGLLVRSGVAVRVPRVRTPSRSLRACPTRSLPADPVRGAAQALGPQGPRRDRAQARLDLPPGALAGAPPRHPPRNAGARIRSTRLRSAPRLGHAAPEGAARRTGMPARDPPRHVWQGGGADAEEPQRLAALRQQLAPRLDPADDGVKQAAARRHRRRRSARASSACRRSASTARLFWGLDASRCSPPTCAATRGSIPAELGTRRRAARRRSRDV